MDGYTIVRGKTLSQVKRDVFQALLATKIKHEMVSPTLYKLKLESKSGKNVFGKRTVKFSLAINGAEENLYLEQKYTSSQPPTYALTFSHISGSHHKFKKAYEQLDYLITHPYEAMTVCSQPHGTPMALDIGKAQVKFATPNLQRKTLPISQRPRVNSSNSGLEDSGSDTESDDEILRPTINHHRPKNPIKI
ncbi:Serine/threonine-protein kinase BRSK2-like [Oopsacas minuta]|uniref:Serine/threonine-protein kinase BRSK2-like n=1 Tax=Oopsacas minuta TaxID=111878 RepID=A0AAV7KGE1_9METZ|nr:Serine/threonine-protein kinase BRSK2-like [Oopsacas minuta]